MNEFYVGYLPKAPVGIARRIRAVVVLLFIFAAIAAIVFARVQRTFAPSVFEYGKLGTNEGTIEQKPYPMLIVGRSGSAEPGASRYLLVAEGKHGADSQVSAFAGKTVRLRGTRIYRDNQTMIEVASGSISVMGDSRQPQTASTELGAFELIGEIVDSKCYLGVMNPGSGKVHRDCAVRCISGGIPPVFATNDFKGSPAILLLTDLDQKPLSKEAFLKLVAQPVRIRGRVVKTGETLYLETEPSAISALP
jgi:hypothetical protein